MPRATVNVNDTIRKDLKTLPEGFVVLRRLSYGEKLTRRAMVSKMRVETSKGKDLQGEMQMVSEQATLFDFQKCIVDHNLEDENGAKLNFNNVSVIQQLDPRIGEEIDTLISNENNFDEDDDDKGNS